MSTTFAELKTLWKNVSDWVTGTVASTPKMMAVFMPGNPYIVEQDCAVADQNYDIDVNTNLGRNAHYGFIRSKSTNTGTVQVAISYNGVDFSGFMTELLPGETMTLDGMDINTIRVKSNVVGDDVIVEVH